MRTTEVAELRNENTALKDLLTWASIPDRQVWSGGTDSYYALAGEHLYSAETAEGLCLVLGIGEPEQKVDGGA